MEKAIFVRKACNLKDHRQCAVAYKMQADPYKIEKEIELEKDEFDSLTKDFFANRDWITKNIDNMWREDGVWHCILVKTSGSDIGILIESEGYDYARYTAEIKL